MKVDGVVEAKADYKKNWAWAKYDPAKTSPEKLVEAINEKTPFEAKLAEKKKDGKKETSGTAPPCC